VHRTVGEQNQDGGADVATLASPASAATTTRAAETESAEAAARVEAEAPATGPESGLKAGSERTVAAGAVFTEMFAEFATGLPPLLVQVAALMGVEPEAEPAGLWCEWVVHGESPYFRQETPYAFPIDQRYIGNYRDATFGRRPSAMHKSWCRFLLVERDAGLLARGG
jgi:hypothetical protein